MSSRSWVKILWNFLCFIRSSSHVCTMKLYIHKSKHAWTHTHARATTEIVYMHSNSRFTCLISAFDFKHLVSYQHLLIKTSSIVYRLPSIVSVFIISPCFRHTCLLSTIWWRHISSREHSSLVISETSGLGQICHHLTSHPVIYLIVNRKWALILAGWWRQRRWMVDDRR